MTDTQLDLDAIEAREAAATPGPWEVELEQCDCSDGLCGHGTYVSAVYANGERRTDFVDFPDADWQFAISARTAVPAMAAEIRRLRARVAELEREAVEVNRNKIRLSYRQLAAQAREERDYEGETTVLQQLADHEADWKRQDAAAVEAHVVADDSDDGTPRHEIWSPHCDNGCCR